MTDAKRLTAAGIELFMSISEIRALGNAIKARSAHPGAEGGADHPQPTPGAGLVEECIRLTNILRSKSYNHGVADSTPKLHKLRRAAVEAQASDALENLVDAIQRLAAKGSGAPPASQNTSDYIQSIEDAHKSAGESTLHFGDDIQHTSGLVDEADEERDWRVTIEDGTSFIVRAKNIGEVVKLVPNAQAVQQ